MMRRVLPWSFACLLALAGAASAAQAPAPAATPKNPPAQATPPAATHQPPAAPAAQQPTEKGMVWVNLSTKVFHREGDPLYGKTKHGKFMTEADAVKAGYREAKAPKAGKHKGSSKKK